MEDTLNDTAYLSMSEITKKLFDRKFLSDIQFTIDGKLIYAHSLELMKRSVVFQELLEPTMGEKKLIPITDYKYESFYQFIRYCYTDQCTISDGILLELFKLARYYRVIKLENKLINSSSNVDAKLLLFEYSVLEKYEGLRNHLEVSIAQKYPAFLRSDTFLKLHPDTITQLLQFDAVGNIMREIDIFEVLVRWMNNYCATNEIDLAQRRTLFDKQIQLIRFPTIRIRDLRDFKIRYKDLLTKEDFMTIGSQVTFDYEIEERVWNSKLRQNFTLPVEWRSYPAKQKFQSHFIVTNEYFLSAIRFSNPMRGLVEISIIEKLKGGNEVDNLTFKQELVSEYPINFINLGETYMLLPDYLYTLGINFVEENDNADEDEELLGLYRCESMKVVCNEPLMGVKFSQVSPNLIEILVKPNDNSESTDSEDEVTPPEAAQSNKEPILSNQIKSKSHKDQLVLDNSEEDYGFQIFE